ncbi:MAG: sulfatase-like hydrolase/transferase [Nocardioides sp.]
MRRTTAALAGLTLLAACGAPVQQFHEHPGPVEQPGFVDLAGSVDLAPQSVVGSSTIERAQPPNIVLVLMDDFSMDLVQTMQHARTMRREGASYAHSYVVDSLCCVSRTSLATGQYPHQTGVRTNTANLPNAVGPIGGWEAFRTYGNAQRSVSLRLREAGYKTGLVGKYLNQYEPVPGQAPPPVPPGWSHWRAVFGSAYDGWDFESTAVEDGEVVIRHHPAPPPEASERDKDAAYVGTFIEDEALRFLRQHRDDRAPYFLQVAPFAAHQRVGGDGHYPTDPRFPPAFRDRGGAGSCGAVPCPSLDADDVPGRGDDLTDNVPRHPDGSAAEQWRTYPYALTDAQVEVRLRSRARMVQSVDRMLGRILRTVDDNTYVVLTSDNGYHVGRPGLGSGKATPFDSDVRVPLLIVGPGVEQGTRTEVVSNLDLAPTFEDLAGLRSPAYRSGVSLVPTLREAGVNRRDLTFFEHTYAPSLGFDPDATYIGASMDIIPSYVAVRSRTALLVRLDLDPSWDGVEHAWEFYDYTDVGWEQTNEYGDPEHAAQIARLTRKFRQFDACSSFVRDDVVPQECRNLTRGRSPVPPGGR